MTSRARLAVLRRVTVSLFESLPALLLALALLAPAIAVLA